MQLTDTHVIIKTQAGLCNRLRVVLSYLEYAKSINKKLRVYWMKDRFCNGNFLDYFEPIPDVEIVHEKTNDPIFGKGLFLCHPDFMNESTLRWQLLIPKQHIRKKINYKINTLCNNFIAVHIRRTDHIHDAINANRYVNDESFIEWIYQNINGKNLYVATDNMNTHLKFKRIFKNKLVCKPPTMEAQNWRCSSLDDAIIDLFVCAQSKAFMGTKGSSFSSTIEALKYTNA